MLTRLSHLGTLKAGNLMGISNRLSTQGDWVFFEREVDRLTKSRGTGCRATTHPLPRGENKMSMCLSPFVYLSDGMAGYGELGKVWEARWSWVQIQHSGLLASVSLSLSCDLSGPFASLCELWWMVTGMNACLPCSHSHTVGS